jgi:PPOX class probable FMN-dependent enzyme
MMAHIKTLDDLRTLYAHPKGRPLKKQLDCLETHSKHFLSLSPFLVISSSAPGGLQDASPRGEEPGFVQVVDDRSIAIPDRPGNNRMDTFSNIIENSQVGLLFLIPGVDETLRINGQAEIRDDAVLIDLFSTQAKKPKSVLLVYVKEVYLHCAKALMRSKIWRNEAQISRDQLPSMSQMIKDQTKSCMPLETQDEMKLRYKDTLY